ncbi:hypothetical protein BLA60_19750 [Actinophytocola xinjiangensis]|uniref:PPE domain-containing protein n=1 Tax=Actinophytocola xinjiangensis TaxID=485602 RepID=A0A7Z1AXN6_9PSEU|nr:PPE domain-containing protein [Actinophytocola xinjiangensis]OLF09406.1 hypothetical protein BLA60_19750 [Actinophytocola xinjiangensis]
MTVHGERDIPAAGEVNPAAYDHETLKRWTDEADTGAAQAVADTWTSTGAALVEAAETLRRAASDSEAGWAGPAAAAMRARLAEIADWSANTGGQITAASASIARQGEAAEVARRAMPDPVPYDPAQLIRDAGEDGPLALAGLPQRLYNQKQLHDAAHEDAVRVVAQRDRAMGGAAGEVVVFDRPPLLDGG